MVEDDVTFTQMVIHSSINPTWHDSDSLKSEVSVQMNWRLKIIGGDFVPYNIVITKFGEQVTDMLYGLIKIYWIRIN